MGQRQPDRADLPPAGPQRIDDAPGDDEVRLGVVMAEREIEGRVVPGGRRRRRRAPRRRPTRRERGTTRRDSLSSIVNTFITWIQGSAQTLGAPGLFVIAFLDSSFLSLPQINDLLLVLSVTRSPELMPLYVAMSTLGSIAGCVVMY